MQKNNIHGKGLFKRLNISKQSNPVTTAMEKFTIDKQKQRSGSRARTAWSASASRAMPGGPEPSEAGVGGAALSRPLTMNFCTLMGKVAE